MRYSYIARAKVPTIKYKFSIVRIIITPHCHALKYKVAFPRNKVALVKYKFTLCDRYQFIFIINKVTIIINTEKIVRYKVTLQDKKSQ